MEIIDEGSSRYYTLRGQSATQNREALSWLFSGDRRLKQPILSELGRIGQPEAIRHVAQHICDLRPRPDQAVAMIRQWQTGTPTPSPG